MKKGKSGPLFSFYLIGAGSFILAAATIFYFSIPHFIYAIFMGLVLTLWGVYSQYKASNDQIDDMKKEIATLRNEINTLKSKITSVAQAKPLTTKAD